MSNGWIGVDLDGTLAHYEGWKGETHIGAPVPKMVERVQRWLGEGREVRIFTARVSDPDKAAAATEVIKAWCLDHIGVALPITCRKDYAMIELWDDRAVQVVTNTGERVGKSTHGLDYEHGSRRSPRTFDNKLG